MTTAVVVRRAGGQERPMPPDAVRYVREFHALMVDRRRREADLRAVEMLDRLGRALRFVPYIPEDEL